MVWWKKDDVTEEQEILQFIDEVQKRLAICKNKAEKDAVINIILDRLGHKHKVTGAFKEMKDYNEDNIQSTKKMRRLMELE